MRRTTLAVFATTALLTACSDDGGTDTSAPTSTTSTAPTAAGDEAAFVDTVRADPLADEFDDQELVDTGRAMCDFWADGVGQGTVVGATVEAGKYQPTTAVGIAVAAQTHLCPDIDVAP